MTLDEAVDTLLGEASAHVVKNIGIDPGLWLHGWNAGLALAYYDSARLVALTEEPRVMAEWPKFVDWKDALVNAAGGVQ